jgi:hypothetical protein
MLGEVRGRATDCNRLQWTETPDHRHHLLRRRRWLAAPHRDGKCGSTRLHSICSCNITVYSREHMALLVTKATQARQLHLSGCRHYRRAGACRNCLLSGHPHLLWSAFLQAHRMCHHRSHCRREPYASWTRRQAWRHQTHRNQLMWMMGRRLTLHRRCSCIVGSKKRARSACLTLFLLAPDLCTNKMNLRACVTLCLWTYAGMQISVILYQLCWVQILRS